jgi:hypothetical protein
MVNCRQTKLWRRVPCSWGLIALFVATFAGGCSSKSAEAIHSASPRLRVVAVLYGRYMSDYSGAMPANEQEFVKYIDARDQKLVQQYGFSNAASLLANTGDKPRLVVLYRDERKRSGTRYVALEEVEGGVNRYAVDVLGIVDELSSEQATPLLAGKS